jgi:hypothetical protein
MLYSQIVVKLLEHIAAMDGQNHGTFVAVTLQELTAAIAEGDASVTERKLKFAMDELEGHGLIEHRAYATGISSPYLLVYRGLDVTGPGLRFIEALQAQAKSESKKQSWFWSGVEKAANLSQLIGIVMQAAARAAGLGSDRGAF